MKPSKNLESQLASTSNVSGSQIPNQPDIRTVTIDGITEVKDEDLLYRVQKQCFRYMGLYLSDIHVEQCFRRGRPRYNAEGEIENKGRPRTVVCHFVDLACRNTVLQRRFNLRGHKVYVNEHHPFEIEQDRIRQYPIVKKARGMPEYKDCVQHIANKIVINNVAYGVEDFPNLTDAQKSEVIDAMLDHAIRPALANDGAGLALTPTAAATSLHGHPPEQSNNAFGSNMLLT